jgi:hypothetical protein
MLGADRRWVNPLRGLAIRTGKVIHPLLAAQMSVVRNQLVGGSQGAVRGLGLQGKCITVLRDPAAPIPVVSQYGSRLL